MEPSFYIYAILFGTGIFAGFIDAIVGGGGLITIPALLLCGIPPQLALATNKLQGVFGLVSSVSVYYKRINIKHLGVAIGATAFGALCGTKAVLLINQRAIMVLILVILTLIFIYTLLRPNLGSSTVNAKMGDKKFYLLFGLVLGFYDGFLGAGAGSFWIFASIIFLGLDIRQASMNTKVLNFTSNFVSLITFFFLYKILWGIGIAMGIGQIIGAYLGAKFTLRVNLRLIRTLFLVVVFLTLAKLGYDYFFK